MALPSLPSKMLADIGGRPMVLHPVQAALDAGLDPVLVVAGHAAEAVEAAVGGLPVTVVRVRTPGAPMAASLRAGIDSVPAGCAGAAVLLGDMPGVRAEHLRLLTRAFTQAGGRMIVAPTCNGRRGNPVLWPRALFPELMTVEGDQGGREVLRRNAQTLLAVPVDACTDGGVGVLRDIDTSDDLAAFTKRG